MLRDLAVGQTRAQSGVLAYCRPVSAQHRTRDESLSVPQDQIHDRDQDPNTPQEETRAPVAGQRRVILVTGMSGAGKQSVLRALEDLGFEAIDNMPLDLWGQALAGSASSLGDGADSARGPLALGLDVRTRGFEPAAIADLVTTMRALAGLQVTLLYLDADDEVLQRRFNETRRRHPLAPDRPLSDGIGQERQLMTSLRDQADLVIDTSRTGIPDLRHMVASRVVGLMQGDLALHFISFAYKDGLPRSADLVFDVRFLRNPHYDPSLRPQTGRDPAVQRYVSEDEDFKLYFKRLTDLLALSLRRHGQEGKSYLTVAIGCSGGKHRSVYMAERLARWAQGRGHRVSLRHQVLGLFSKFEPQAGAGRRRQDEAPTPEIDPQREGPSHAA